MEVLFGLLFLLPFDITSPWKWKKKARDPGYVSIRYEIDEEVLGVRRNHMIAIDNPLNSKSYVDRLWIINAKSYIMETQPQPNH